MELAPGGGRSASPPPAASEAHGNARSRQTKTVLTGSLGERITVHKISGSNRWECPSPYCEKSFKTAATLGEHFKTCRQSPTAPPNSSVSEVRRPHLPLRSLASVPFRLGHNSHKGANDSFWLPFSASQKPKAHHRLPPEVSNLHPLIHLEGLGFAFNSCHGYTVCLKCQRCVNPEALFNHLVKHTSNHPDWRSYLTPAVATDLDSAAGNNQRNEKLWALFHESLENLPDVPLATYPPSNPQPVGAPHDPVEGLPVTSNGWSCAVPDCYYSAGTLQAFSRHNQTCHPTLAQPPKPSSAFVQRLVDLNDCPYFAVRDPTEVLAGLAQPESQPSSDDIREVLAALNRGGRRAAQEDTSDTRSLSVHAFLLQKESCLCASVTPEHLLDAAGPPRANVVWEECCGLLVAKYFNDPRSAQSESDSFLLRLLRSPSLLRDGVSTRQWNLLQEDKSASNYSAYFTRLVLSTLRQASTQVGFPSPA